MTAREAAVLTEREVQDFAVAVTAFAAGRMDGAQTVTTVVAVAERILADRLGDTPTATPGAYPCCDECGPGCSGHHDHPCRCQTPEPFDVKAEAKALFKAHAELTREGPA